MRPSKATRRSSRADVRRREDVGESRGSRVTYAFVQDVASTWEQYERVAAPTVEPPPDGLILHVAGPTDEGFRIIDVWESKQAWQDFRAQRLAPAIAAFGGPSRPEPTFRDLRPAHVVLPDRTHWASLEEQTKKEEQ